MKICKLGLWIIGAIILLSANTFAQEKQKITIEWIHTHEGLRIASVPEFVWLSDGTLLINDIRKPMSERTFEKINPNTGQRVAVLNMKKALENLQVFIGIDSTPPILPWPPEFDNLGKRALYMFDRNIYVLELGTANFIRVTQTSDEEKCAHFSPDGNKVAYVRKNDLYVYDLTTHNEKRLTTDGFDSKLNGTLSWLYWEEIFDRADIGYWWSDDSKKIAYLQTDESAVSLMRWLDFKPAVPNELLQRYPKAGGTNPKVKVGIVDIGTTQTTWADFSEHAYEYIARVEWLPDSKRVSIQTLNRGQTELSLFFADAGTGKPVLILKETDSAWVNIQDDLHFLEDGKYFIWASERSGYDHLYRYTMEGKLVNAITQGEWTLRASGGKSVLAGMNKKDGWLYFTALEKSSVEKHLYRVNFDGNNMQRLSQEDGTHKISISPDGRHYVDNYSSVSSLPGLYLHKADGKLVSVLAPPRPELVTRFEMQYPELFTIPTRDGFRMPTSIMKPKDFDPNKKYPLIVYVYGGPSAPVVSNSWNKDIWFYQILLDHGFMVAKVDNRSATAIGKKLENTV
ncbi:DPP IV N-terminal domain-containing protein, partial [bacterium]|nr:DPP IV N-terminal domain-containing protein [bacterium]